jgi:PAS domain S-box-containing protein
MSWHSQAGERAGREWARGAPVPSPGSRWRLRSRSGWLRYGLAVACVALAILARATLTPVWGLKLPYFTLYPAVVFAAWVGGLGPGLLTTGLCAVVATYFWIPPAHTFLIGDHGDLVSLLAFLFIGAAISTLSGLLRRRERYASAILESISDGLAVLDRRWHFRYVNEEGVRLTGRPRKDLIGRSIWEVFPDLAGTAFEKEARRAATHGEPARLEFHYEPLGGWAEVRMYPSGAGLAIYFRDIGPQKQAEQMSSRLAAIVSSSDDAIVGKDTNGVITSWNQAAERMFGYPAAEAIGRHITIIIPPDRRHEEDAVLARIRSGQSVDHFETIRVRKDGRLIEVSITVSPIRGADGVIVGASKIARDIGVQRQAARERTELLSRAQVAREEAEAANRAKDDFLTTLSHELRTPLNAVFGWAAMLQTAQMDEATRARAIDTIVRNANAQVQLIDDLLDVSRIASGKLRLEPQPLDPRPVVEGAVEAVRPAALAKGIRLDTGLDPKAGMIIGDPNRLEQVVWNLLSNAVKFTPRGGSVQIHLRERGSQVEIEVRDSGIGIAPDLLPHVFERFRQGDSSSTRLQGGLGLGLTLVKQLVEMHGGTVTAESRGVDQGATFTVRLPLQVAGGPATPAPPRPWADGPVPSSAGGRLQGVRVLAVDDDGDGLALITAILGQAGATIAVSHSAAEGFDMFVTDTPDVLISDVEMPGEDGYSLIRRIRALDPARGGRVPAIALTAYGRREDRVRSIGAGFSMHVPKPVDPSELLMLVASLSSRW